MKNKKLMDVLRIIIFTFIANFFFWLLMKINPDALFKNSLFGMCTPMAAHILTRLITRDKASVRELLLPANLRGNIKYYLSAVWVPYVMFIVSTILIVIAYVDDFHIKDCPISDNMGDFILILLMTVGNSFFMFYICLGEEYGWRAYLTPKLESLMPEPLALIVSGIIWGMWHGGIIRDYGHNFGTGYKFFPYAGYIAMCISCIFMGAFFTWLTKKTNSIYPAAIAHTAIDLINITDFFIPEKTAENISLTGQGGFNYGCLAMSGLTLGGVVFFVMLCIDYHKKKSQTEQA